MQGVPDPFVVKTLEKAVQKVFSNYRSHYKELYRNAAPGYGVGTLDSSVLQLIRMPRLETTLPEVPNKLDTSPVISFPDTQPLTATARDFRAKIIYLDDDRKDDKEGYYTFHAKGFAEAIERTKEIMGHEIFVRADDPTLTSGWDDLPLLATNHKLENGSTYDNTLAPASPSEALLETILDYGAKIPSAGGWPVRENGLTIITGDKYARRWRQILGANTAIELVSTSSATTGVNPNPNIPSIFATEDGTRVVISTPYLADDRDQFFVFSNHELAFKTRWSEVYTYQHNDPRGVAQVAKLRLVTWWGDARRIIGIKN